MTLDQFIVFCVGVPVIVCCIGVGAVLCWSQYRFGRRRVAFQRLESAARRAGPQTPEEEEAGMHSH